MLSDPHQMFQITGPLAMLGWLALVLSPLAPRLADWVATLVIPALLSVFKRRVALAVMTVPALMIYIMAVALGLYWGWA